MAKAQHATEVKDSTDSAPSADRLYYDAIKARIKGEDKESEALLKQVIKTKPDDAAPYYDLSRLALKHNDAEKATEYIKKAIALDGSNKWYHEQYANALTLRSDFAGAADEYAGLAKREKFNEPYLERSALLYQRIGKYKEALAQLEALYKRSGDDDALLQQQQVYLKMNDVAGAARVVRELITQNPKEPRYYALLVELYENNKQPDKAKEAIDEMAKRFPADPSLQIAQATSALKRGDTAHYREYLRKAVINKNLDAETQIGLLRGYIDDLSADSLRRREAASITEQIVAQHPEHVGLLSFYAYVLGQNRRNEEAAQALKKAIALKKDDFSIWQQLLYGYTDRQSADSLIKWSEKAARLFPNQAVVHYLNGVGHFNKKEYPAAISAINRAIDLEPEEKGEELAQMHTMLGDIYNTTKQYALSDSNYSAALRLDPRNASTLNNYAYYLSVRNTRLDDAARMSKESLKIRPGEGTFLDTYGWILYQQGKYKDALEYIQKAVDTNPAEADPTLFEHLGAVQYKLGNKDAAVTAWQRAKERGSENADIDKMISERKLYE